MPRGTGRDRERIRDQRLREEDLRPELRLALFADDLLPERFVARPFAALREVLRCEREPELLRDLEEVP